MVEEILTRKNYPKYFLPEIRPFIDEINDDEIPIIDEFAISNLSILTDKSKYLKNITIPGDFEEKRKNGENDGEICEVIRKDMIDEFISFVNKNNYNLNESIKSSIYETNDFLLNSISYPKLIEYAAFFGSIQIFKYLYKNNVKLTSNLWNYAIHGNDAEMIHILEENNVEMKIEELINTAIKCHHNDIVNYFINKIIEDEESSCIFNVTKSALKYYNFSFIDKNIDENQLENNPIALKYKKLAENLKKISAIGLAIKSVVTPLTSGVENGNIDVVKSLLQNDNLDINLPLKEYGAKSGIRLPTLVEKNALLIAVENNNLEMIKLLLSNDKIDVNNRSKIIKSSIVNNFKQTVNKLTIEKNGFHLAVTNGYIDIIKVFLSNDKVDINFPAINSMHRENKLGNNPDVIFILQDIEWTALHIALDKKNVEIVKLLLENDKLNINSYIKNLSIKQADYSLQEEIEIKETALHFAINNNFMEVIKLLLNNNKIDVNLKKIENHRLQKIENKETINEGQAYETALCMSVNANNYDVVKILVKKEELEINEPFIVEFPEGKSFPNMSYKRKTPLHLAIESGNKEMVNILLQNLKIDVNVVDEKGKKTIELTNDEDIKKLLTKI